MVPRSRDRHQRRPRPSPRLWRTMLRPMDVVIRLVVGRGSTGWWKWPTTKLLPHPHGLALMLAICATGFTGATCGQDGDGLIGARYKLFASLEGGRYHDAISYGRRLRTNCARSGRGAKEAMSVPVGPPQHRVEGWSGDRPGNVYSADETTSWSLVGQVSFRSDSLKPRVWQHNLHLGAQVFVFSALGAFYEVTSRRGRAGHGLSLGYCHVLFTKEPEDFIRYWVPLQYTFFRGDRHGWEMGIGLLYGGAIGVRELPTRNLLGRSLFATWQPIGYRFEGFDHRMTIRLFPYFTLYVHEFDGPLKEWNKSRNRNEYGTLGLYSCVSIGWRIQ